MSKQAIYDFGNTKEYGLGNYYRNRPVGYFPYSDSYNFGISPYKLVYNNLNVGVQAVGLKGWQEQTVEACDKLQYIVHLTHNLRRQGVSGGGTAIGFQIPDDLAKAKCLLSIKIIKPVVSTIKAFFCDYSTWENGFIGTDEKTYWSIFEGEKADIPDKWLFPSPQIEGALAEVNLENNVNFNTIGFYMFGDIDNDNSEFYCRIRLLTNDRFQFYLKMYSTTNIFVRSEIGEGLKQNWGQPYAYWTRSDDIF